MFTVINSELKTLTNKVEKNWPQINIWLNDQFKSSVTLPFYSSIDLRESHFKIAPVDTNLFPAGFNNITIDPELTNRCSNLIAKYLSKHPKLAKTKKILLIAESLTRNSYYLSNVKSLKEILENANYEVKVGMLNHDDLDYQDGTVALDVNNEQLIIEKLIKTDRKLETVSGFLPDLIILNTDLTQGVSELLIEIDQNIIPDTKYGWYNRSKYQHFEKYNILVESLAKDFQFDPWLISTFIKRSTNINFIEKVGLEHIAKQVDELINKIRVKYQEYQINDKPYVFVKSDNGTYGLGITKVYNPEQILNLNKRTRQSINKIKHGVINSTVMIQEGIPTVLSSENYDLNNRYPAEELIYSIGGEPAASLIRFNPRKESSDNLNSPGMKIKLIHNPIAKINELIVRLANLATCYE